MTKLATKTNKLGQRTDLIEVNDHYHGADHLTWQVWTWDRPGRYSATNHAALATATARFTKA